MLFLLMALIKSFYGNLKECQYQKSELKKKDSIKSPSTLDNSFSPR